MPGIVIYRSSLLILKESTQEEETESQKDEVNLLSHDSSVGSENQCLCLHSLSAQQWIS